MDQDEPGTPRQRFERALKEWPAFRDCDWWRDDRSYVLHPTPVAELKAVLRGVSDLRVKFGPEGIHDLVRVVLIRSPTTRRF